MTLQRQDDTEFLERLFLSPGAPFGEGVEVRLEGESRPKLWANMQASLGGCHLQGRAGQGMGGQRRAGRGSCAWGLCATGPSCLPGLLPC